jgi:putative ABC transport system permease protein
LILGQGLLLVGMGVAIDLVAAFALTSLVQAALLPNMSARDPLTFAATAALLSAVALVASCIPAIRASRIDPLVALRTE